MALTRSREDMREAAFRFANVQGVTARLRHPTDDGDDAVNRALGSLYRKLNEANSDQRYLASTNVTTSSGQSVYSLPSNFDHLISVDMLANSMRTWLGAFEPSERARLTDPTIAYTGIPIAYRLEGGNVELLPTPRDSYTVRLWYVPTSPQLTQDAQTFDTVSRLDDYVIAYAARILATKDKAWDLVAECRNVCTELLEEIALIGRRLDHNSPARITDVYEHNRFGRHNRSRGCR